MRALADAVHYYYGHRYDRATQYLQQLANNERWEKSELPGLPFQQATQPEGMGAPQYIFHQAVLDALAPSVPLRALFSRER